MRGERGYSKAFTLVELIVVITILAVLSAIGFVAFSGYLAGTRDTNRISQLKSISDGLELYRTKHDLPIPEDKVDINASGTVIAYQGYVGKNVLETIEYSSEGVDPKDGTYFSYYLTKDKKYYQLMAFLEESDNLQNTKVAFSPFFKGSTLKGGGINKTFALDYTARYPTVYGKKLGILTDENNTPVQEIEDIKINGLDIVNTNSGFIARFTDASEDKIEGTGGLLGTLLISSRDKYLSCKGILLKNKNIYGLDGNYFIQPEGKARLKVYCDMTTDEGGWTKISHYKKSPYYYKSIGVKISDVEKMFFEYTRDNGTKGPFRLGIDKINITADGYKMSSVLELSDLISLDKIGGPKRAGGVKSGIWKTRIITGGDSCIDENELNNLPSGISWGSCGGSSAVNCTPNPGNVIFRNGHNLTLISNKGLSRCNGSSYSNQANDYIDVFVK